MTERYPLAWPPGVPRRARHQRKPAPYRVARKPISIYEALKRLSDEVDRLGAKQFILSSNVEVRLDGLPRSDRRDPDDPGVALYFVLNGKPRAMPCDTFDTVGGNIAAVAAHIEATRRIARLGVASLDQMFTPFDALPAPQSKPSSFRPWWIVLELGTRTPTRDQVETAYRALAKVRHPDGGGSTEQFQELQAAKQEALRHAV